ncbi:MAG: iron ABC transporter permease [Oscillospiraceae bacterium]|nr:iron ABC transporter permease [Oscillospiraceae bacterium]
MKPSITSPTRKTKYLCLIGTILLIALGCVSLFVGKYPLSLEKLLSGDDTQLRVFLTLRVSRTVVGIIGGIALGIAGFVYQTVFRNPLASPDIIGVSSGASAGAAAGILFLSGATAVTICAFAGALLAVILSLALSGLDRSGKNSTIVLAGIAVHAMAQTVLMALKLTADPERELASIEYWIMGSLNGISAYSIGGNLILCVLCMLALLIVHRQVILLSAEEGEARMLGVPVTALRVAILVIATLAVAAVVSLTGLISFVGLLAPHGARLLTKNNRLGTMTLSGLMGGLLLCGADLLARSVAATELPVSIFTSLLGAPFLIFLIVRGRRQV